MEHVKCCGYAVDMSGEFTILNFAYNIDNYSEQW